MNRPPRLHDATDAGNERATLGAADSQSTAKGDDIRTHRRVPRAPKHLWVAASTWLYNLMNGIAQIWIVRMIVQHLGVDAYGAYVLLSGLLAWFLLSDLGLGYSLQNYVSRCRATGVDHRPVFKRLAQGLAAIGAGAVCLAMLAARMLGPVLLGKFGFLSQGGRVTACAIVFCLFALYGLCAVGFKLWFAEHRGYFANVLLAAATAATLCLIAYATRCPSNTRFQWAVVAMALPNTVAAMGAITVHLLSVRGVRPAAWRECAPLIRKAGQFWLSGVLNLAVTQVDLIIVARVRSPQDVATYGLLARILAVPFMVYVAVLQAAWPVFAELTSGGRWDEVFGNLRKQIAGGVVWMVASGAALWVAMPFVLPVVAPKSNIHVPASLLVLYVASQLANIWAGSYATVLASMNDMRVYLAASVFQAAISAPLQILLIERLGLPGVVFGITLSYLCTVAWVLPWRVRYLARTAAGHRASGAA